MPETKSKTCRDDLARRVCLFASAEIRDGNMSLSQASELTEEVARNLPLVDSEADALSLIKKIDTEDQNLVGLQRRIFMDMELDSRAQMADAVREFAVEYLAQDPARVAEITEAATKDGANIDQLAQDYPELKEYLLKKDANTRSN